MSAPLTGVVAILRPLYQCGRMVEVSCLCIEHRPRGADVSITRAEAIALRQQSEPGDLYCSECGAIIVPRTETVTDAVLDALELIIPRHLPVL